MANNITQSTNFLAQNYMPYNLQTVWLKDQIANNKAIPLMWKNGYNIILAKEDKALETFIKNFETDCKFNQHCQEVEKLLSMWGLAIATLNRTKTGQIKIVLADPGFINNIGFRFDEELGAEVYKRINHSNFSYVVREVWDTEKVQRFGFDVNGKSMSIGEVNAKIPKELQLEEVEYHNLGFVPVVLFRNKPQYNLYGGANTSSFWLNQADDYGANRLQELFEEAICAVRKELHNNKTRVFANFSPIDIDEYQSGKKGNPFLQTEWLKNQQTVGKNPVGNTSDLIQTVMGDPKFSAYDEHLSWIKKEYYEACGYNYKQEGGTKTATEVQFDNSLDKSTTDRKRIVREDDMSRLWRKIIAMAGIGYDYYEMVKKPPFTFTINNAITANMPPHALAQWYSHERNQGVISPIQYLMETKGMKREDAENHMSQILEDNDKYTMEVEYDEESEEDTKAEIESNKDKKEE